MSTDETTSAPDPSRVSLSEADRERIRKLIHDSMSGEFSTSRGSKPATFPLTPFYDDDRGSIVVTSPVAYARKARTVAENPRVSVLLHDDTGAYLVTGDATVSDDLAANASYVRALNEREPETPKRKANEEKYEFIDSRLGNALIGWLGHRLVIEFEPVSVEHVTESPATADVPAWPAVGMDRKEAAQYDRAVLTVVGPNDYPVTFPVESIRVEDEFATLEPLPDVQIADGQPACLLLHWHDEASIYLGQRQIRGRVSIVDGVPRFVPASSSTLRNDGLRDTVRFLLDGRRRTKSYFARHADVGGSTDAKRSAPSATDEATSSGGKSGETSPDANTGSTPSGPRGWPIVGNTVQFLRDPFGFYEALPAYGDVVRYRIAGTTWTAILHPSAVERVLVSESHRFRRYNFEELGFEFPSEGLFFTEGAQWRRQRKVIQPAFAPAKLAPFADVVVDETVATIEQWSDGELVLANQVFSDLTLELLTTTLFDVDLDDRRVVITDAAHSLANRVDTRNLSAVLPGWIPTRRNRDFNRRMARFDALVADLIEERRAADVPRTDLLSTLLALTDPADVGGSTDAAGDEALERVSDGRGESADAAAFTDEELRDQLVTFLFAGHETTALVFTYTLLLVATHDDVRRRLVAEVETVCGDRDPTVEDVPALEFTEHVIRESMRRYPPIYVLFREALEDVTIDGYLIPAGTKLALPQFICHADARWWDDPHEFRPDRWATEEIEELPEYAYFPFGGGPRHCVGMRFAKLILTLGIATIVRHVDVELASDPDPDLHMAATLAPADDVVVRVRKRG